MAGSLAGKATGPRFGPTCTPPSLNLSCLSYYCVRSPSHSKEIYERKAGEEKIEQWKDRIYVKCADYQGQREVAATH